MALSLQQLDAAARHTVELPLNPPETTPSSPIVTSSTSSISKVPLELLETILLYAVDEFASPELTSSDRDKVFRMREELETGVSTIVPALRFRLVCHKFRDASWKAFGKIIAVTTFDIRSRQSMHNLWAISTNPRLAPWIEALNFTCNITDGFYIDPVQLARRLTPDLVEDLRQKLERVRQDDLLWFPDLFSAFELDRLADHLRVGMLAQILATYVEKMINVNKIVYFWHENLRPQRFKPVIAGGIGDKSWETEIAIGREGEAAHLGLHVLITALNNAGTQPRELDLAVEGIDLHAFVSTVPTESFQKVFAKAESLTLRNRYYPMTLDLKERSQVCLTRTIFPVLRSLVIDKFTKYSDDTAVPFPLESDRPRLTEMTIIKCSYIRRMNSFLVHYSKHLQSLALINSVSLRLRDILYVTRRMDLEVLHLRQEAVRIYGDISENRIWADVLENVHAWRWAEENSMCCLSGAAGTVILEPPLFRKYVDSVHAHTEWCFQISKRLSRSV